MKTYDATKVIWHHKQVKAARENLDRAITARDAAMEEMEDYEHDFIFHCTSENEPYMIEVDDSWGDHKVTELSKTKPGGGPPEQDQFGRDIV